MPFRRDGRFGRGLLLALILLVAFPLDVSAASPRSGSSGGAATSDGPAGPFRIDLATPNDFVRQFNDQQCVGASIQMMLNMIGLQDDRSAATQRRLWDLASTLSWLTGEGPARTHHPDGANAKGWTRALVQLGAGPYIIWTEATYTGALRVATDAIRATGRPVGLLVWRGEHAWVLSGFTATGDPATEPAGTITGLYVEDPWYPRTSSVWGRSPAPGSLLSPKTLAADFVPWQRRHNTAWNGRYVLVLPRVLPPTPASPRLR